MNKIVCSIMPAHNEEENIENSISDMLEQTYLLHKIIVVNDLSTDKTPILVNQLIEKYPNRIVLLNTQEANLRAGAINKGLEYIGENIEDCAFVLVGDADSRFDKNLIKEGIRSLENSEKIGGVCSIAGVLKPVFSKKSNFFINVKRWILWRIQKLEYAGFDSTRTRDWENVLILHGLCSMFRFDALESVKGYEVNHLLEDYKLTLKLKKAGWKTIFNPNMLAETKVPQTVRSLIRQRIRWMRGGIQILLEEGVDKHTFEDAFNHFIFILLFSIILFVVFFQIFLFGWHIQFNTSLLAMTLAVTGYLFSLYNLKFVRNLDAIDIIIRVIILPELLFAIGYSLLQLYAYFSTIFKIKTNW